MSTNHQRLLLWVAVFGAIVSGTGFVFCAGFLPPPSPQMRADEIAAIYQTSTNLKRLGFMMMMIGGGLHFGIYATISAQMRRMKGTSDVLVYSQLGLGAVNSVMLTVPSVIFTAAAFRPDRNPESIAALHDLAWLMTTMPSSMFVLQQVIVAIAIFSDESKHLVFPRWLAYVCLFTAMTYMGGTNFITFFKLGPFAWNGVLAFYVVAVAFVVWELSMFIMLFKAIRSEEVASQKVAQAF